MTRKTAWLYEQDRSKGVGLTIRVEHEESAPDLTVSIKLSREEEEKSFQITKELMQRIEESAALLKEVPFPRRPAEDGPIIQHRFEDQESGLVLMWEIPPFKRHDDIKHRYKIGDGAGLDYSFKSLEMLENFVKMLKRSMLARVPE